MGKIGCKKNKIGLQCDEKIDFDKKPTDLFAKATKYVLFPPDYHCCECYDFMGEMNPRQLCCKIKCPYDVFKKEDLLEMQVYHLRSSPYYTDKKSNHYTKYHDAIGEFIERNKTFDVSNEFTTGEDF